MEQHAGAQSGEDDDFQPDKVALQPGAACFQLGGSAGSAKEIDDQGSQDAEGTGEQEYTCCHNNSAQAKASVTDERHGGRQQHDVAQAGQREGGAKPEDAATTAIGDQACPARFLAEVELSRTI